MARFGCFDTYLAIGFKSNQYNWQYGRRKNPLIGLGLTHYSGSWHFHKHVPQVRSAQIHLHWFHIIQNKRNKAMHHYHLQALQESTPAFLVQKLQRVWVVSWLVPLKEGRWVCRWLEAILLDTPPPTTNSFDLKQALNGWRLCLFGLAWLEKRNGDFMVIYHGRKKTNLKHISGKNKCRWSLTVQTCYVCMTIFNHLQNV